MPHRAVSHLHLLPQPCGPDDPALEKAPWDADFRSAQVPSGDSGINVLIDISRQASFHFMWDVPPALRTHGHRVSPSQASLNSVLDPTGFSRIRVPMEGRFPFALWPNFDWNVVVTIAPQNYAGLPYLPEEVEALDHFVDSGGGLIVAPDIDFACKDMQGITPQNVIARFSAEVVNERTTCLGRSLPTLKTGGGDGWTTLATTDDGGIVAAERVVGKGHVVLISTQELLCWNDSATTPAGWHRAERLAFWALLISRASAGRSPVGGSRELPIEMSGGGPIYPELEIKLGDVTVFYAANSNPEHIVTCRDILPKVRVVCEQWMPSKPLNETMYMDISGGDGGGWAINAYYPKEVGMISAQREGIVSVYAHEITHTLAGPANDQGGYAGTFPDAGWFSEAHAGYYQGKACVVFNGDATHRGTMDLASAEARAMDFAHLKEDQGGTAWHKMWTVWQLMDERYSSTWYPRWLWVKNERWANDPLHVLSWDEVVEDMSIAVGEDQFPFFKAIGTTLTKERFPKAVFQGRKLTLSVSGLTVRKADPKPRIEPCGDYRKPVPIVGNGVLE